MVAQTLILSPAFDSRQMFHAGTDKITRRDILQSTSQVDLSSRACVRACVQRAKFIRSNELVRPGGAPPKVDAIATRLHQYVIKRLVDWWRGGRPPNHVFRASVDALFLFFSA